MPLNFEPRIRNGLIEIPEEYWEQLSRTDSDEQVRVIVLTAEQNSAPVGQANGDLIEQLLTRPLEIPNFIPLSREAVHDRNA